MDTTLRSEARIFTSNPILIALSEIENPSLIQDFCGAVITGNALSAELPSFAQKTIYLCGDISKVKAFDLETARRIFVIKEISHGYTENKDSKTWTLVDLGLVPMSVHGMGVYYRRFFDPSFDYFNSIRTEHAFQSLTESSKPGTAFRTGIYLTPVQQQDDELHFRLLRCSTNLSGPTENFAAIDSQIVDALNQEAAVHFQNTAELNHVLAQIYHNTPGDATQKQTKARISAHADKTKDMPVNGMMAFCTFYEQLERLSPLANESFDLGYKGISGLTRLHFRLKVPSPLYPPEFTLTLYPNSVFFMPLSTNRLYTHEIKSPKLDAGLLPTRLGYVVRCSRTEAVHKDGQTFLKSAGKRVKLESPTPEGMNALRKLYAEENKSQDFVDYGDQFLFSMNQGDYLAPEYGIKDAFRSYTLPVRENLFEELLASAQFENVGKGRQGTVLVRPDETGCTPIVRTTTSYSVPAQGFRSVHEQLAEQIQKMASLVQGFNNALIETYTNAYTTMGSHSDQALDLADDSFIAVFSCYKYPERANPPRKLIIESKQAGRDPFEIPLRHNRVVVFSVDTNRHFRHKIVLDTSTPTPDNTWLGITFRVSKTFVQFREEQAYFLDDTCLTLANDEDRRTFFQLRRRENHETDFSYPRMTCTISKSDLMPPEPSNHK